MQSGFLLLPHGKIYINITARHTDLVHKERSIGEGMDTEPIASCGTLANLSEELARAVLDDLRLSPRYYLKPA